MRGLFVVILAFGANGVALAQDRTQLYYDFIDAAKEATTRGDLEAAKRYYQGAGERRPLLVQHAVRHARVCWLLRDTVCATSCVKHALDLGFTGPEVLEDSVLAAYWILPSAKENRALWQRYEAMVIPELKRELEAMFREDQAARMSIDWEKADSPDSTMRRAVWRSIEDMDRRHTSRVIEIVKEHGVPSIHQVGLIGNKAIFFAFIHCPDLDTISAYCPQLSRSVREGGSPAIWYAYVIDRIMSRTSGETMFGTTGYTDRTDGVTYFTTVVPEQTDLLRETMGLPRMGRNQE